MVLLVFTLLHASCGVPVALCAWPGTGFVLKQKDDLAAVAPKSDWELNFV